MPKKVIREIKRATRKRFSAEKKIAIVLEGLKGSFVMQISDQAKLLTANLY